MEIERKFLVEQVPAIAQEDAEPIEQGYLVIEPDGGEVRLRRKGERLLLTAKRGEGMVRDEVEIELEPAEFEALWPLTEGRRLGKVRHRVEHAGNTIELDLYGGALEGLVVAEIEFDSVQDAKRFEGPEWLGKEITGERRYTNRSLAEHGAPD